MENVYYKQSRNSQPSTTPDQLSIVKGVKMVRFPGEEIQRLATVLSITYCDLYRAVYNRPPL